MSSTITAAGFIATSSSEKHLLIALPDGSSVRGTGKSGSYLGGLSYFPSAAGAASGVLERITAITNQAGESLQFEVKPCTVDVPADLTANHGLELAEAFEAAVTDDEHRAEYRNLRAFSTAYETYIYDGTGDGTRPARTRRRRVEDRTPVLTIEEDALVRPNGTTYLPRTLVGHTDAAVLRRARDMSIYALLRGEPGAGKTALADATFPDLIAFGCTGDTTVANLVGSWMPNPDGTFRWEDGPLTTAMKEGRVLLVDEIDRLAHEVSAVLHSALDGRRTIRIEDRPDLPPVQAIEGFYVVGTYNPRNLGGKPLPEAILSRFAVQIEVDTDFDAAAAMGVPEQFVTLGRNLTAQSNAAVTDGGEPIWAPQMRELLAAKQAIDAGFGEAFALAAIVDACPVPEDLPRVRAVAREVFGETPKAMRLGDRA